MKIEKLTVSKLLSKLTPKGRVRLLDGIVKGESPTAVLEDLGFERARMGRFGLNYWRVKG